ncbi:MAG: hypothetical protein ACLPID_03105 [Beijerinckiaceae bacterium]
MGTHGFAAKLLVQKPKRNANHYQADDRPDEIQKTLHDAPTTADGRLEIRAKIAAKPLIADINPRHDALPHKSLPVLFAGVGVPARRPRRRFYPIDTNNRQVNKLEHSFIGKV